MNKKGFTLIEVMVAVAILSIGIVMVMQLFSGGLKSGKLSGDYTKAVVLAKAKMEELILNPVSGSGEFKEETGTHALRWNAEVEQHVISSDSPVKQITENKILKLKITVSWSESDKQRSCELTTLRTVSEENK